MIRLNPNKDSCPCASGKLYRDCCLGPNNTLRTKPSITCPPAPKTGFSNPGCYAAELVDCSENLSREHFISQGILRVLSRNGKVKIYGFRWQEENTTLELPTSTVSSRILCTRHNNALSGLDAMALRLFQGIDNVILQVARQDQVFLFHGADLERWLLKTLCGAVFSKNAQTGADSIDWRPSLLWLNLLFGGVAFPDHWGFYFADADIIERGFTFGVFWNPDDDVWGAKISFNDKYFLFVMDTCYGGTPCQRIYARHKADISPPFGRNSMSGSPEYFYKFTKSFSRNAMRDGEKGQRSDVVTLRQQTSFPGDRTSSRLGLLY
jgi:hypothetical protein